MPFGPGSKLSPLRTAGPMVSLVHRPPCASVAKPPSARDGAAQPLGDPLREEPL